MGKALTMTERASNQELARRSWLFMEGARRLYDHKGDMWFFELWHHLSDCYEALALRTDGEKENDGK